MKARKKKTAVHIQHRNGDASMRLYTCLTAQPGHKGERGPNRHQTIMYRSNDSFNSVRFHQLVKTSFSFDPTAVGHAMHRIYNGIQWTRQGNKKQKYKMAHQHLLACNAHCKRPFERFLKWCIFQSRKRHYSIVYLFCNDYKDGNQITTVKDIQQTMMMIMRMTAMTMIV